MGSPWTRIPPASLDDHDDDDVEDEESDDEETKAERRESNAVYSFHPRHPLFRHYAQRLRSKIKTTTKAEPRPPKYPGPPRAERSKAWEKAAQAWAEAGAGAGAGAVQAVDV